MDRTIDTDEERRKEESRREEQRQQEERSQQEQREQEQKQYEERRQQEQRAQEQKQYEERRQQELKQNDERRLQSLKEQEQRIREMKQGEDVLQQHEEHVEDVRQKDREPEVAQKLEEHREPERELGKDDKAQRHEAEVPPVPGMEMQMRPTWDRRPDPDLEHERTKALEANVTAERNAFIQEAKDMVGEEKFSKALENNKMSEEELAGAVHKEHDKQMETAQKLFPNNTAEENKEFLSKMHRMDKDERKEYMAKELAEKRGADLLTNGESIKKDVQDLYKSIDRVHAPQQEMERAKEVEQERLQVQAQQLERTRVLAR